MVKGYFKEKEYIITDMKPRRPLYNYLWNDECVCRCDQFGNGFSWMATGNERRDIDRGVRNVYIKDKANGKTWAANRNYEDFTFDRHICRVGLGYQTIESEYEGLNTEFSLMVPRKDAVVLYHVKVTNGNAFEKDIGVYFCIQPNPALSWHDACGFADYSEKSGGLLYCHDGYWLKTDYTKLFVAADKPFTAFDVGCENFRGEYNGFHNPIGLKREKLSSKGTTFETNYVAAIQYDVKLQAGESFEFNVCSFAARTEKECAEKKIIYLAENYFYEQLKLQEELNASYSDTFVLDCPDEILNKQVNLWFKRQLSLGKTWGRLYGKGFRDVMQDVTAFASMDVSLARERILQALKYQFEDGNPIRMFEPNCRYPYNDGGVWITGALLSYLNESGDKSILKEKLPYLKGDSYENADVTLDTSDNLPYVAGKSGSVLEHVKAAIDYLLNCRGERNLVLWRGGDWNDSLNCAGLNNKGESVWLSIATVKALDEFMEILKIAGEDAEKSVRYEEEKAKLKLAIEKHGKNGGHYIYGINDYGEIIGGEERMFLNPQSWAVLANVSGKNSLEKAMDEVEDRLKCKFGYVQCAPSFLKGSERIGRISYFQPGLVENGAVYNHGVAFKIVADCLLGRGDRAYESLKLISFDNPDNPDNGVEPYAVCNMYMGPENPYIAGYAPMSWITGTAGWLYRAVTEYICGVKATMNGLEIKPCFPSQWNYIKVKRIYRSVIYEIEFRRSEKNHIILDGIEIVGNVLPVGEKGKTYKAEVYFK